MSKKVKQSQVIKPQMRIHMVQSVKSYGGNQKTLQVFLKRFEDKKSGLIKISKIISMMKILSLNRHLYEVEHILLQNSTKPAGFIHKQKLLKLLQRQVKYEPGNLNNDQIEQIFLSFAKNGKIGLQQLEKVFQQMRIPSTENQRANMIKNFARNGTHLDKYDFIQVISNQ